MRRQTTPWVGLIVSLVVAGSLAAAPPGEANEIAMKIAKAYGFDGWDQINRLDFTFNVKAGDSTTARHWTWWPKQNKVRQRFPESDKDPITYHRNELDTASDAVIAADKKFINDHYWLLFPFQPVWSNPKVSHGDSPALPIGDGKAAKSQVIVQYPDEGGYTPGDAYWLYLDNNNRLVQWQYLPGGDEDKAVAHTWDKHRKLGPIIVSLEHKGADGNFRLFFTKVKAKLENGDTVTPQPMN